MPFTDLDEHLAEAFGEQVADLYTLRRQGSAEAYRTREAKDRSNQRRREALRSKREARWRAEALAGIRPSRCDGPDCNNLLSPTPKRGAGISLYCGEDCSSARGYRRRAAAHGGAPAPERRRRYIKAD